MDKGTLTFLGFTDNMPDSRIDRENRQVIIQQTMTEQLYKGLKGNGVDLTSKFENWDRYLLEQLKLILCNINLLCSENS